MATQPRGSVKIREEECKGCGLCVEACPPHCLELLPGLSAYGVHPAHYTGDGCTGCGICVKVCPVNNIKIVDKKPVWQHSCENCRACYVWCPARAIRGGITANGFYYRHPAVNLTDFTKQVS